MAKTTTVAKAQLFIGSETYTSGSTTPLGLADFSTDTYTPIGGMVTIGDYGDAAEEIKVSLISEDRVLKMKGQRDAGDIALECAFNDADPGQMALLQANADDMNRSFKVVLPNGSAAGTGTTTYFRAIVLSAQTKLGAANATVMLSTKLAINSAPFAVAAS